MPFDSLVKFQSLTQFSVDHLSQLCVVFNSFWASFLPWLMWLTVSSHHHVIYTCYSRVLSISCFDIISPYGMIFCSIKEIQFLSTGFLLLTMFKSYYYYYHHLYKPAMIPHTYHKLQDQSWPYKSGKKIFTKLGVNLYSRAEIQTFTTE